MIGIEEHVDYAKLKDALVGSRSSYTGVNKSSLP